MRRPLGLRPRPGHAGGIARGTAGAGFRRQRRVAAEAHSPVARGDERKWPGNRSRGWRAGAVGNGLGAHRPGRFSLGRPGDIPVGGPHQSRTRLS